MTDNFKRERGDPRFWQKLDLDTEAANSAALCFPEGWPNGPGYALEGHPSWEGLCDELRSIGGRRRDLDDLAEQYMHYHAQAYKTCVWHPAFWYAQGYNFDDMARRTVAVNAMMDCQRQMTSQPEKPDVFADLLLATLAQPLRRLPPPSHETVIDADPPHEQRYGQGQDLTKQTPFDGGDYPRIDP